MCGCACVCVWVCVCVCAVTEFDIEKREKAQRSRCIYIKIALFPLFRLTRTFKQYLLKCNLNAANLCYQMCKVFKYFNIKSSELYMEA